MLFILRLICRLIWRIVVRPILVLLLLIGIILGVLFGYPYIRDRYMEHKQYRIDNTILREVYNGLEHANIPEGITSIDPQAFRQWALINLFPDKYYGVNIRSLTVPDGIESIEAGTFQYCRRLEKVSLPESVTRIGAEAFQGCSSLETVELPGNLSKIEASTFR